MNIAQILQHNLIGKLINHGLVFLVNLFIVRLTSPGESGNYFNELYLLNALAFLFSAGLDYSAVSLISKNPSHQARIHRLLGLVTVIFVLVLTGFVFLLHSPTGHFFQQPALAILLFATGNLLLIFYQGILSALKKFNLQNLLLGISNLVFLGYLLGRYGPSGRAAIEDLALAYGILFFVQGIAMFLVSRKRPGTNDPSLPAAGFYRSGLLIMFSSLLYFVFLRADNFFVEKYCSPVTLGNYVQCGKIGQYFIYFSSIVSSTLLPFLASESAINSYKEWIALMRPYAWWLLIGASLIALTGHTVFPLLFGEAFGEMYGLMVILLPGYLCLGMLTLINAVYISRGNVRVIFWGDLLGLLLVVGFSYWLVPRYGVRAAAMTSSVAYIIVFLFLLSGLRKQFDQAK